MPEQLRHTKIVATLGPTTDPAGMLDALFKAGVNVVRLNFSHGDPTEQAHRIAMARAAAQRVGVEIGILADLPGPKIRIGHFADGKIELKAGARFDLIASNTPPMGSEREVGVSYLGLSADVKQGDILLLDDGMVQLEVTAIEDERIITQVLNDGQLVDRKGLNKQGGGLSLGALTQRDRELIGIVSNMGVDFIAISFCRSAEDMHEARRVAQSHGSIAGLVAKIERAEAIDHLAEIIEASDVVMVARGDLGVETGDAELPGLQKKIIREALRLNKVVITATQMLQSMVESPIATRAEVLDVANAVIDGTDAVMLSAETAAGQYPVKAVEAMARICVGAERQLQTASDYAKVADLLTRGDQAIAMATMFLAEHIEVAAIVAMTESGNTPSFLSRFRAKVPIYAISRHPEARRRMALMRDVFPIDFDSRGLSPSEAAKGSIRLLVETQRLVAGDRVVFTSGEHMQTHGATNTLRLLEVDAKGGCSGFAEL